MKSPFACALVLLSTFNLQLSTFAQGSLTPPGAPAPAMKTLSQVEPRTPISAPAFTITNSGSYYLTTNLVGAAGQSGITINVDDVTLDLNGFALTGVPGSLHGVTAAAGRRNLSVRNGTIRGWGQAGVNLAGAENSRFESLRVNGNNTGGVLAGRYCLVEECSIELNLNNAGISVGNNSQVRECTVVSNAYQGIVTGDGCRVSGCTVFANSTGGLDGIATGFGCVVQSCTSTRNGTPTGTQGGGIAVDEGSSVLGCAASSNAVEGVFAQFGSVIKDCSASGNSIGISTSAGVSVQGCSAEYNRSLGIRAFAGSTVANCTAFYNGGHGISTTNGCTVRGCTADSNGGDGIQVPYQCLVLDNNCNGNMGAGVHATSTDNRIEGNSATANAVGIQVDLPYNLVIRNHASFNGGGDTNQNFVVAGTNALGTVETMKTMNTNKNPHANFGF